jgi:hypothetical protein
MKSNVIKLVVALVTTNFCAHAQEVKFSATITNSLSAPITIFDRLWEGDRVKLAIVEPGKAVRVTDLSLNVQNIFSRSTLVVAKDGTDIAEIILLKQDSDGNHKPAVAAHMLPIPHWIGRSHMLREELVEDANRFDVQINLKQDSDGTLDPSTFSIGI